MSWFEMLLPPKIKTSGGFGKKDIPEGLWEKCPACSAVLYRAELERNLDVCPKCSHHLRISARRRLDMLLDESPREEIAVTMKATDPLKFKDLKKYRDRLSEAQKKTSESDALVVVKGVLRCIGTGCCDVTIVFSISQMSLRWLARYGSVPFRALVEFSIAEDQTSPWVRFKPPFLHRMLD